MRLNQKFFVGVVAAAVLTAIALPFLLRPQAEAAVVNTTWGNIKCMYGGCPDYTPPPPPPPPPPPKE